jgi:endonuclease-3
MPAKKKSAAKPAKSRQTAGSTGGRAKPQAAGRAGVKAAAATGGGAKPKPAGKRRPRESAAALAARVEHIVAGLAKEYADAECALHHKNAFELLVATILSAQCTDERVNMVTPALFKSFPTPAAFAAAPIDKIEKAIQSTGFFRNKAKSIQAASKAIVEKHGGKVPQELDEMVELAGVGRKTANVVLGVAYGKATGVVVDTHVGRLSRRLGLTDHDDPVKVEADLMAILPQSEWIDFSHRLIHHGRRVCQARKPKCDACVLEELCPKIGVGV